MAKTNCGTCNISGYYAENNLTDNFGQNLPTALNCNPGCSCQKYQYNPGVGRLPLTRFKCVPKRAQQNKDRHLNASGFLGTGVSGFKVIWWSLGALLLLSVVGKGVRIYKQSKY